MASAVSFSVLLPFDTIWWSVSTAYGTFTLLAYLTLQHYDGKTSPGS